MRPRLPRKHPPPRRFRSRSHDRNAASPRSAEPGCSKIPSVCIAPSTRKGVCVYGGENFYTRPASRADRRGLPRSRFRSECAARGHDVDGGRGQGVARDSRARACERDAVRLPRAISWKPVLRHGEITPQRMLIFYDGVYPSTPEDVIPINFTLNCLEIDRPTGA